MNKRQLKKSVMRNVSKLYDMAFERKRFRRDVAIICGRGQETQEHLLQWWLRELCANTPHSKLWE
mgnify:CR=1 FL=1|jgi:hypothetical protein